MASTDLSMYRGDDKSIVVTIVDNSGTAVNLTNGSVFFTINGSRPITDAGSVYQKIVVSHTNPSAGITTISIPSSSSTNFTPGAYWYDVQLKQSTGSISTVVLGRFTIDADVTRTTT